MFRFAALLLAFLVPASAAPSGKVEFIRVWPDWKDAASFMNITQYFGGKESAWGWKVMRTHPESRVGYYFLARVKNPGPAMNGTQFVLQVVTQDAAETKTYTFKANIPSGSHIFEVGLTGSDWAGKRAHPVAWKLALQDEEGAEVTAKASFLWENPSP